MPINSSTIDTQGGLSLGENEPQFSLIFSALSIVNQEITENATHYPRVAIVDFGLFKIWSTS